MPYGGLPYNIHMPLRQSKRERLEARITPEQKRIFERAARIRGTSLTDFVVASAQQAATETINSFEVLTLRGAGRDVFVDALLHPPAPNAAARAAARRYRQRVRS